MGRYLYFIVPLILAIAFGGYYFGKFKPDYEQQVALKHQAELDRIAKEEADRKAAQARAEAEAARKAAEREAEDQKKKDEAEAKRLAELKKLNDATDAAEKEAAALQEKYNALEIELTETRRAREKADQQAFTMARDIDLLQIDRRNAEINLQMDTQRVAARVDASSLVEMPIFDRPPDTK